VLLAQNLFRRPNLLTKYISTTAYCCTPSGKAVFVCVSKLGGGGGGDDNNNNNSFSLSSI